MSIEILKHHDTFKVLHHNGYFEEWVMDHSLESPKTHMLLGFCISICQIWCSRQSNPDGACGQLKCRVPAG